MGGTDQTALDAEIVPPQWLIVVRRDQSGLYTSLRARFAPNRQVQVILDRRHDEPTPPSRSAANRRASLTGSERAVWEDLGFRVVHRGPGVEVYQAVPPPTGPA